MTTPTATDIPESRWTDALGRPVRLLFILGTCCVVLGGLVAAVTDPLRISDGSWLAAYLVLVAGVAQCAIAAMPRWLAARPISRRLNQTQPVCWNLGNLLVITGTLIGLPWCVDLGSVLLVVGLIIAWRAVRHSAKRGRGTRFVGQAYRCLLLLLLVSIPVGATLAHLRAPL